MKRREFITLLGGAVARPLLASAQQTPKLPIIGFLSPMTASVENQRVPAFVQRLRAAGWIEGHSVATAPYAPYGSVWRYPLPRSGVPSGISRPRLAHP